MARRPHLSKYQRLAEYLAAQPGRTVTLTFAEIEALIGAPLPAGAYAATFWASAYRKAPVRVLRAAGWHVPWRAARQTVREHRLTFERLRADSAP